METKSAVKSKTINFNAVVLGVIAALAAFDISVSNELYLAIVALIPLANIILRFVTKGAITLSNGKPNVSGQLRFGAIVMVLLTALCLLTAISGLTGCATNQTATQQMAAQTDDPATIALGTYTDAQDAYIDAFKLYVPYRSVLQQANPALDKKIMGYFGKANKILNEWERIGSVSPDDEASFRALLRKVWLEQALLLEQKLKTEED